MLPSSDLFTVDCFPLIGGGCQSLAVKVQICTLQIQFWETAHSLVETVSRVCKSKKSKKNKQNYLINFPLPNSKEDRKKEILYLWCSAI
jgi:hypothetical protein